MHNSGKGIRYANEVLKLKRRKESIRGYKT